MGTGTSFANTLPRMTNGDGEYQLNAVPPGEYTLEVHGGEPQQGFYVLNGRVRATVVDRDVTADINLGKRATVTFLVVTRLPDVPGPAAA